MAETLETTPATGTSAGRSRLRPAVAGAASLGVILSATAGTGRADPYAPPLPAPAPTAATLGARFAAERGAIERALETARRVGDTDRGKAFGALLRPGRRFLFFDPRGGGRAVEVIGDLARARRVAVLVPGADTTLSTFDTRGGKPWSTPGGGARALYEQALRAQAGHGRPDRGRAGRGQAGPKPGLAVVAWLGYAAPRTFSSGVLTDERAAEGGERLRRFLKGLHRINPGAGVGLLCHSYGSVVCGRAALDGPGSPAWRQVTDLAVYGSPGTAAWSASMLSGTARVWAGRGTGDWTAGVPHVRVFGLGLGPDPVSSSFGARVFDAGTAGHSDYLAPRSASLRNLTRIALGRAAQVTPG